jgi:hypothetical protein
MLAEKIRNYFDLGLVAPSAPQQVPLMLGKPKKNWRRDLVWQLATWLSVTLGLFLRPAIAALSTAGDFRSLPRTMSVQALLASAVIAFVTYPPLMRTLSRRRNRINFQHFLAAFAFGLFLNVGTFEVIKTAAH